MLHVIAIIFLSKYDEPKKTWKFMSSMNLDNLIIFF